MKKQQKNTAKKVNKPEEGLTVSTQLDNTFERASTLDEKRLAVQMIQSGLLPNTWQIDQLDDPETRRKGK
jgi:hypothetical protein